MSYSLVVIGYLLVRIFADLLGKKSSKLSIGQMLKSFIIFSFTVFLAYIEIEVVTSLLAREFSELISVSLTAVSFILGYELSSLLFSKFLRKEEMRVQKLDFKTFLLYFCNVFFGIIFLIIVTFVLLYF